MCKGRGATYEAHRGTVAMPDCPFANGSPSAAPLLVLRTIQILQQTPLLAFPAKAGIHLCRGHRLSPVKRD
jgi:hypothetical protein